MLSFPLGVGHAGLDSLYDDVSLELGHSGDNLEDELARGRGGVEVVLVGYEVDAQGVELVEGVDQVFEGPREPVELPDGQDFELSSLCGDHHFIEGRPIGVFAAEALVDINLVELPAGSADELLELLELQVYLLPAGGDACVDDC